MWRPCAVRANRNPPLLAAAKNWNIEHGFYAAEKKSETKSAEDSWWKKHVSGPLADFLREHFGPKNKEKSNVAGNIGISHIRLSKAPGKEIVVTVGLAKGDKNISLAEGTRLVFTDANWDWRRFNLATDLERAEKVDAGVLNSSDPNLKPFFDRGGKLLIYHGWSDPQVPPGNNLHRVVIYRDGGDKAIQTLPFTTYPPQGSTTPADAPPQGMHGIVAERRGVQGRFRTNKPWRPYVVGGPALNIYDTSDETNAKGGFNIGVGAEHRGGLFGEVKFGLIDSPDVKFGIGFKF